jgi:spermidine synthase
VNSVIYWLFLASGAAGLIYEVVWMRMLMRILGATVFAYTVALSAFMLGLALGGWHYGRRIDRRGRPLVTYAGLEAGVGLWALILPWLLMPMGPVFATAARTLSGAPVLLDIVRCVMAFAFLLVPTILMGGTLPVLSKLAVTRRQELGDKVGRLYAVNTFGAILGAGAAGLYLIGRIGEFRTTMVGVGLNLSAAAVAALIATRTGTSRASDAAAKPDATETPAEDAAHTRGRNALVLAMAAVTGFTVLAYEVLWTRTGVLIIANNTYSFTLMLVAFLAGIALGSAVMAAVFRRWPLDLPARWKVFASLQFLIGIVVLVSFGSTTEVVTALQPLWKAIRPVFGGTVQGPFPAIPVLLTPLTLLSGASFPLAASLYTRRLNQVGKAVGSVYLSNTVGAAAGSAVAGFVLIPMLGIGNSFLVCVAINLVAALTVALAIPGSSRRARLRAIALGAVGTGVLLAFVLNATDGLNVPRRLLESRLKRPRRHCIFYEEDINGIVSVWLDPLRPDDPWLNRKQLYIDSLPMAAGSRYGMIYERLQAHYPLLLHPAPKDVLVVCLGTGTTLGSAAQYPARRLDCVELSRTVVEAGVCFTDETHNVLADPRLTIHIGDGRNHLLATTQKYDVITAEPMHPHVAGTVNLYTREYFELVRDRLRPGGVCSHWIPVHNMNAEEVKMAAAAFRKVFPYAVVFLETADAIIIGSDRPIEIDVSRWRRILNEPRIGRDLEEVGLDSVLALLATYMMDTAAIDRYVGDTPAVTDDLPVLEFFAVSGGQSNRWTENMRDILVHRDPPRQLLARLSGELRPEEEQALRQLYELESVYLNAYADRVSGNLEEARQGFAAVLQAVPGDRRAEVNLAIVELEIARRSGGGRGR